MWFCRRDHASPDSVHLRSPSFFLNDLTHRQRPDLWVPSNSGVPSNSRGTSNIGCVGVGESGVWTGGGGAWGSGGWGGGGGCAVRVWNIAPGRCGFSVDAATFMRDHRRNGDGKPLSAGHTPLPATHHHWSRGQRSSDRRSGFDDGWESSVWPIVGLDAAWPPPPAFWAGRANFACARLGLVEY